jgi:hypothetical protein
MITFAGPNRKAKGKKETRSREAEDIKKFFENIFGKQTEVNGFTLKIPKLKKINPEK